MPRQRNNSSPAPDSPSAVPRRQELLDLASSVATLTQNLQDSMLSVGSQLSDIDSNTERLDELELKLDDLESKLDDLESKLDNLDAAYDAPPPPPRRRSSRSPSRRPASPAYSPPMGEGKISAKTRRKRIKHKKSKRKKHRKAN